MNLITQLMQIVPKYGIRKGLKTRREKKTYKIKFDIVMISLSDIVVGTTTLQFNNLIRGYEINYEAQNNQYIYMIMCFVITLYIHLMIHYPIHAASLMRENLIQETENYQSCSHRELKASIMHKLLKKIAFQG